MRLDLPHVFQGDIPGAGPSACMFASWYQVLRSAVGGSDFPSLVDLFRRAVEHGCVRESDAWILDHSKLPELVGLPAGHVMVDVAPDPVAAAQLVRRNLADGRAVHARVSGHSMAIVGMEAIDGKDYLLLDDVGRSSADRGDTHVDLADIITFHDPSDGATDIGWRTLQANPKRVGVFRPSIRYRRPLWRLFALKEATT